MRYRLFLELDRKTREKYLKVLHLIWHRKEFRINSNRFLLVRKIRPKHITRLMGCRVRVDVLEKYGLIQVIEKVATKPRAKYYLYKVTEGILG